MTLLEQTIISIAAQRLTETKDLAASDRVASGKAMGDLFTLAEIAHVQDSGMSDSAAAELIKLEKEAVSLVHAMEKSMSKTICDYPLEVGEVVIMPAGAEVLSVYSQGKQIFLCALADPNQIKDHRTFDVYQHGKVVRDDDCLSFIGSVLLEGEKQASHVFEYIVPY